jgi:UDP-N-acetylmuramate--alanine ligase
VPDRDPEVRAAHEAGVPVWQRPALLGALTEANPAIGFAGTHGKTTTTAMAVTALRGLGVDPSFLVGGRLVGLNTGAHVGSDVFVLEADEAYGTFRHLTLSSLLVTNIEADHLDYYGTVAALEDAFAQVGDAVGGPRVACIDDAGVRRLAQRVPVTTYGRSSDADWVLSDLDHGPAGIEFRLHHAGDDWQFSVPTPGTHTARNAAGVAALFAELGHPVEGVAEALRDFGGVHRRYEIRAVSAGVTIVDDYAHHPTEIAATVEAAIAATPGRVIAVFQPHRYSRTADLGPEFGEPLARCDRVVVMDVYPAGEQPVIGVSGRLVANAVGAAGGDVEYRRTHAEVTPFIADLATEGDTVLLLGAGDVNRLAGPIARTLEAEG